MRPTISRQVRLANNQYIIRQTAVVEEVLDKEQIENRIALMEKTVKERINELRGVLEEIDDLKGIVLGVASEAKEGDEQPETEPPIGEEQRA